MVLCALGKMNHYLACKVIGLKIRDLVFGDLRVPRGCATHASWYVIRLITLVIHYSAVIKHKALVRHNLVCSACEDVVQRLWMTMYCWCM